MIKNNHQAELFIAFEGIDGSGKSSQISFLQEKLTHHLHKVHQTCEPTNGPIGRMIRDIFTGKMDGDHHTIAGLFVADRLHHLLNKNDGILLKMSRGYTVLTDRYVFSSYAYQGAHVDLDWVIAANAESQRILQPDLHIFLDISVDTAMERLKKGREYMELFETRENLEKVHKTYIDILERFKNDQNILIVDGAQPQEVIAEEIWRTVRPMLED
ncbi:dTMP kinase [Membranicola marinus]|uniref:Thymidylate kinase n=1 Tax=Membranihabitans marinus TaxID=1227546 RepID=A0A953HUG3_9BACT|nr:dTMP kinase [Membranihabitans marinus]MBY5956686.1 dTMP kinase [Membranihabitans marinus]